MAQYGDACNLFSSRGAAAVQAKLDVLKRHCEEVGRDYATIERTTLGTAHLAADHMSSGEIVDQCRALASVGIQHAIFNMPNVHEISPIRSFGREIIPAVAEF